MIDHFIQLKWGAAVGEDALLQSDPKDICGYFIESSEPQRWIDIAVSVSADPMQCGFFPIWVEHCVRGVFIECARCEAGAIAGNGMEKVVPAGVLPMKSVVLPQSILATRLWIPSQSRIEPMPLPSEWPLLITSDEEWLIWHPVFGLLSIDPMSRIGIESLIAPPLGASNGWRSAVEGTAYPERLLRVDAPRPPTLDQWLEKSSDGLGDRRADLLTLPPSRKEQRGKPVENIAAQARSAVGRAVSWMVDQVANRSKNKQNRPMPSDASQSIPTKQNASSAAQWIQAIRTWAKRNMDQWNETLEARRNAAVNRLLEMLDKNPEEGLRYAIPMSDDPSRGLSKPGADLVARDLRWGEIHAGGSDHWSLSWAAQNQLREKYLDLARRELSDGRYERAAAIYAQLLGDFQQAAQALEKGKFYRQAALIYLDRLSNLRKAAEMFVLAGDFDVAIDLLKEMAMHLEAGDLYQRLGQMELAYTEYEKHVEKLVQQGRTCDAADVFVNKLNRPDQAVQILVDQWPIGTQAQACAKKTFDLLSQLGRHDQSIKQIDRLIYHPKIADAGVWPSDFLASLVNRYPNAAVSQHAQQGLFINASQMIRSSPSVDQLSAITASLCKGVPQDRLLHRDAYRVLNDRKSMLATQANARSKALIAKPQRGVIKTLQPVESVSLRSDCDWFGMIPTERGPVCFGERDGTLFLNPTFPSQSPKKKSAQGGGIEIRSFFENEESPRWVRHAGYKNQRGEAFTAIVGGGKAKTEFGEGSMYCFDDALTFLVTPASINVRDCFFPTNFMYSSAENRVPDDDRVLFIAKQNEKVRLGMRDQVGRVAYPQFPAHPGIRNIEQKIAEELIRQSVALTHEQMEQWIASEMMERRWCVAKLGKQLLLSCGTSFCFSEADTILQPFEALSPIQSIRVSNRFTRPRVILGLDSGVMMQWSKADDYHSCVIDDSAKNSQNCFVRTGHIAIAHDAGVDLYENKGLKVKLLATHTSTRGFVGIEAESDAFWTLTKDGLVQKWNTTEF